MRTGLAAACALDERWWLIRVPVKEENGRIIRLEVILLVLRRSCWDTHMMRLLLLYSYKASLGLGSMTADYLIFSCNYRTTGLLELV